MLKKFVLVAGTLLTAAFIATPSASASTHRFHRLHRYVANHGQHIGRVHYAGRLRLHASAGHRSAGHRYGFRVTRRGYALARHVYGHHRSRLVAMRRDQLVQSYATPSFSYAQASAQSGAQVGGASYYSGRNHTASGGYVGAATCAHRTLPFGTRVLVTNLSNARQAVLTVNDRGPFIRGRIVDVSVGAAGTLGMLHSGTAKVSLQVVGGPG